MASTSDWLHFHQNNNITPAATIATANATNINNNNNNNIPSINGQMAQPYATTSPPDLFFSGLISESTVVSTQTTPLQPGPTQLGPAGRVTKPVRRRTRASRRTPTTLLNTDTANFRAMVQQFTGGPNNNSSPQVSNLGPHGFNIGSGLGYGMQYPMGQLQYANATMSSSSHNNVINDNMLMRRDTIDNKNIICDAYFNRGSNINNNNHVNGGGSSSSENRGSNNSFHF